MSIVPETMYLVEDYHHFEKQYDQILKKVQFCQFEQGRMSILRLGEDTWYYWVKNSKNLDPQHYVEE